MRSIPFPQPEGRRRLYAGRTHEVSNQGTSGFASFFDFEGVESDNFSLAQLAAICRGADPGTTLESIEVGMTKNPVLYGDFNVHFFVYFTTAGYDGPEQDLTRGYDRRIQGFVPSAGGFPPGSVLPVGAGGSERQIRTVLSGGVWWIQDTVGTTTTTLGYFPTGEGDAEIPFDLIDSSACEALWYGEVFDDTEVTPSWTPANMGNGIPGTAADADPNTPEPAYLRQMIVERMAGNVWFSTEAGALGDIDPACYSVSGVNTSITPGFDVWFTYGGPGGDAPGCD